MLDTHVVVWLAFEPARLSERARRRIEQARREGEGLAVSDITLLELAIFLSRGRFHFSGSIESFLQNVEKRFAVMPISSRACARIPELPPSYPKDPADRIIGATALVEGLVLITADRTIRRSKAIRAIW